MVQEIPALEIKTPLKSFHTLKILAWHPNKEQFFVVLEIKHRVSRMLRSTKLGPLSAPKLILNHRIDSRKKHDLSGILNSNIYFLFDRCHG
jgi:hypothetical protein